MTEQPQVTPAVEQCPFENSLVEVLVQALGRGVENSLTKRQSCLASPRWSLSVSFNSAGVSPVSKAGSDRKDIRLTRLSSGAGFCETHQHHFITRQQ